MFVTKIEKNLKSLIILDKSLVVGFFDAALLKASLELIPHLLFFNYLIQILLHLNRSINVHKLPFLHSLIKKLLNCLIEIDFITPLDHDCFKHA